MVSTISTRHKTKPKRVTACALKQEHGLEGGLARMTHWPVLISGPTVQADKAPRLQNSLSKYLTFCVIDFHFKSNMYKIAYNMNTLKSYLISLPTNSCRTQSQFILFPNCFNSIIYVCCKILKNKELLLSSEVIEVYFQHLQSTQAELFSQGHLYTVSWEYGFSIVYTIKKLHSKLSFNLSRGRIVYN